jgi:predicted nucleic acid-binding protein
VSTYLDSNFVVKLYVPEHDSPAAVALASRIRGTPRISTLTEVEVASAILRRSPRKTAESLYAMYRRNRAEGRYLIVEVDTTTFSLARQLVERYAVLFSLRSLDAVQLATALQIGARELITLDGSLTKAAEAEGLTVPRI